MTEAAKEAWVSLEQARVAGKSRPRGQEGSQ